jgi:hypothetical protein
LFQVGFCGLRGIRSRLASIFGSLSTALGGVLIGVMAVQPVGLAKTGLLLIGYVLSTVEIGIDWIVLAILAILAKC